MKKILFLISLITYSSLQATGGSLYSRYGIGDLFHYTSANQLSLGGLGVSLNNQKYLNTANPASIYNIKNTKFGAGIINTTSYIDDGIENAMYSNVQFSGFHIAFPVKESLGMGFLLGIQPYSLVKYDVVNENLTNSENIIDQRFDGSGGISKIFFGFSVLLPFDIAVGATFDYYTGSVQYSSTYSYADSVDLLQSIYVNEYKYKGLGTTIGLQSPDLAEIFNVEEITNFRLGASYELSGPINTDTAIIVGTSIGENTFESDRFKTNIPYKLSFGLNFTISDKYLVVLDYLYQPWSKFEHNGLISQNLRDLSLYSIGFEIGDQTKRFATFWELIKIRGGLSFEQSQFEINGEGIDQYGIHAGISLPLGLENTIDIGLMYGMRGTTNSNLVKEDIFKASISLNFGELWFIRREW